MKRTIQAAALCLLAAPLSAATIDGALGGGDSYGAPSALQDTPTGYGDNVNELNAAYAKLSGGALHLLITGNLNTGGEGIVIFLDTRAGGAIAGTVGGGYGVMGSVGGTRTDDWGTDVDGDFSVSPTPGGGSILDPGFNPDVSIEINAGGGGDMQTEDYFINIIDLSLPNEPHADRDLFLGYNFFNQPAATHAYTHSDAAKGGGGAITHAFNNSNVLGVNDANADDPASATTGLELSFSPEFLAGDGQAIKVMVFIANSNGEYLSNQFLGRSGLGGSPNLDNAGFIGGAPLFDARQFPGNQFFTVPEPATLASLGVLTACMPLAVRRRRRPARD